MLDQLRNLLGESATSTTPIIYYCNPLVIADAADQIYFSGSIEVEFTPSAEDANVGTAILVDAESDGWQPKLFVKTQLFDPTPIDWWHYARRGGVTWLGVDDEGSPFSWYIDRAADIYLLSFRQPELEAFPDPSELE